jgi:hypothetical protein
MKNVTILGFLGEGGYRISVTELTTILDNGSLTLRLLIW